MEPGVVCVRERDDSREGEWKQELCVCVCVGEREETVVGVV